MSTEFLFAAKGFARFKELDRGQLSEYVLIGTLMSAVRYHQYLSAQTAVELVFDPK